MVMKWLESYGKWSKIYLFSHILILISNTLIFLLKKETKLMIKLPWMLLKLSKNLVSESNVLPLLLMKQELKSSISRECINLQMVKSETSFKVLFSELQFYAATFHYTSQAGKNQLSLVDMLTVINIKPKILLSKNQENSQWNSYQVMEAKYMNKISLHSQKLVVLAWVCLTLMTVSLDLLDHALNMLSTWIILYI